MRSIVLVVLLSLAACGGGAEPPVAVGPAGDGTSSTSSGPAATSPSPLEVATSEESASEAVEVAVEEASPAPPAPSPSPAPSSSMTQEGSGPPAATISGSAGSLVLEQGSYCWSSGPGQAGLCADTIGPGEQTPAFATSTGEALTVTFDIDAAPDHVELYLTPVDGGGRTTATLDATNPTTYEVEPDTGSYYAVFFTTWDQGDASYHVRLDVS